LLARAALRIKDGGHACGEINIDPQVRVGSCGFPQALAPYAKTFPVVEVQQQGSANLSFRSAAFCCQWRDEPQTSKTGLRYSLRTVKEYQETVEYIHLNPLRRGLVKRPEDWKWSSVHEYAFPARPQARHQPPLRIDRVRIPADERARI
jgi:hypothetical protein